MSKARLVEQPAGSSHMIVGDENPARQDADRAFQHAHVLVEQDMRDLCSIEQRLDGGNQHCVIGTDDLAQVFSPRANDGLRCARPAPSAANRR